MLRPKRNYRLRDIISGSEKKASMVFPCCLHISLSHSFIHGVLWISAPSPRGLASRSFTAAHNLRRARGDLRDGRDINARGARLAAATEMGAYNFGLQMSGANKQTSAPMRSVFRQRCHSEGRAAGGAERRSSIGLSFPTLSNFFSLLIVARR